MEQLFTSHLVNVVRDREQEREITRTERVKAIESLGG